jgi:hypothetical protein
MPSVLHLTRQAQCACSRSCLLQLLSWLNRLNTRETQLLSPPPPGPFTSNRTKIRFRLVILLRSSPWTRPTMQQQLQLEELTTLPLFFLKLHTHCSRNAHRARLRLCNGAVTGSSPAVQKHLKTNINLHYNYTLSPYRAVNTLRLGYTNQSVNAV